MPSVRQWEEPRRLGSIFTGQEVRTSWPLKTGPKSCPETSVQNYYSTPRTILEEFISHLHRGGSLKSRNENLCEWIRGVNVFMLLISEQMWKSKSYTFAYLVRHYKIQRTYIRCLFRVKKMTDAISFDAVFRRCDKTHRLTIYEVAADCTSP